MPRLGFELSPVPPYKDIPHVPVAIYEGGSVADQLRMVHSQQYVGHAFAPQRGMPLDEALDVQSTLVQSVTEGLAEITDTEVRGCTPTHFGRGLEHGTSDIGLHFDNESGETGPEFVVLNVLQGELHATLARHNSRRAVRQAPARAAWPQEPNKPKEYDPLTMLDLSRADLFVAWSLVFVIGNARGRFMGPTGAWHAMVSAGEHPQDRASVSWPLAPSLPRRPRRR